jgi:hypothetical protein
MYFVEVQSHAAFKKLVKHLRFRTAPSAHTIKVMQSLDQTDPSTMIVKHNLEICLFNARATAALQTAQSAAATHLPDQQLSHHMWDLPDEAEHLDDAVAPWPASDDPIWACTVVGAGAATTPLKDWTGTFHMYGSLAAANNWNLYRCARILLLLTVLQICRQALQGEQHEQAKQGERGPAAALMIAAAAAAGRARAKIATLLADTVASFPYCLGKGDARWSFPTAGVAMSAFALLWPTGLVARCPLATREQKVAALACLEYIGRCVGLQRAVALREILAEGWVD